MPHALTERQKEYLHFLKAYLREHEDTPRLEEVAGHFGVKLPTAHKTLEALQRKGYLFFRRSREAGYFIRLAERGGGLEKLIEILIVGKIDPYGELFDFPQQHGHFPIVLQGVDEHEVFALEAAADLPQANILAGDYLICDYGKRPQPGDLCLLPFGLQARRWFLCQVTSLTLDRDMPNFEVALQYPIPEKLLDLTRGQKFHWYPIAYDGQTEDYFTQALEAENIPMGPIPPELKFATVLRLIRNTAI